MKTEELKILWIDDETEILDIGKEIIIKAGYNPIVASNVAEGLELFKKNIDDLVLVICDYVMLNMNGLEFRKASLEFDDKVSFMIISAYVSKQMALEALNLKICGFYEKPFNIDSMLEIIKKQAEERTQFLIEYKAIEQTFYEEANKILEELEEKLLLLDAERANQELINNITRGLHTLKGSSGCLSSNIITKYVHKYEDLFQSIKKNSTPISDGLYEILFKGYDRIKELVGSIPKKKLPQFKLEVLLPELIYEEKKQTDKKNDEKNTNNFEIKVKENISVPIFLLDELENFSGEITVIRNMVLKIISSLENKYSDNKEIHILSELFEEMNKVNSTIQNKISELCKVPIAGVFKPMHRIVRDISKELQKKIQLNIEGDSLRVANSIAEVCSNSLIHLVRNSADHGIENTEERKKKNKLEQGTIKIKCVEVNNDFILTISDDGRGIDPNKIKAKALEKGIFSTTELERMSENEILEIIFCAGFSTASNVTDISGRGVGMDMVKTSVEAAGGKLTIDSSLNVGTKFTLTLPKPKSVTIINSLIVEIKNKLLAIPEENIDIILRINKEDYTKNLYSIYNQRVLKREDKIYPLLEVDKLLKLQGNDKPQSENEFIEVLLIKTEGYFFALPIDNIIDSEEIVLKRLPPIFNRQGLFAGATFMGDGSVGLVLDVKKMAEYSGMNFTKNIAPSGYHNIVDNIELKSHFLLTKIDQKSVYGFPLEYIFRIEEISNNNIQCAGNLEVIKYREQIMPIYSMYDLLDLKNEYLEKPEKLNIIVVKRSEQFIGFKVDEILDIVENENKIETLIADREGILGNTNINNKNVAVINVENIIHKLGDFSGMSHVS